MTEVVEEEEYEVERPYIKRMDPEVKAKWVEALRSGDYPQTSGILCQLVRDEQDGRKPGFCCLGVLSEIAVNEGVIEKGVSDSNKHFAVYGPAVEVKEGVGSTACLPHDVVLWSGVSASNPQVRTDEGHIFSLAALNDNGKSFEEIAELIEVNL